MATKPPTRSRSFFPIEIPRNRRQPAMDIPSGEVPMSQVESGEFSSWCPPPAPGGCWGNLSQTNNWWIPTAELGSDIIFKVSKSNFDEFNYWRNLLVFGPIYVWIGIFHDSWPVKMLDLTNRTFGIWPIKETWWFYQHTWAIYKSNT